MSPINLKKKTFLCVFIHNCKRKKTMSKYGLHSNSEIISFAWKEREDEEERQKKQQNSIFNLALNERMERRHLNIWYHGQGDCLFLHPMDSAWDGGSRAFFISFFIYFYKLRPSM